MVVVVVTRALDRVWTTNSTWRNNGSCLRCAATMLRCSTEYEPCRHASKSCYEPWCVAVGVADRGCSSDRDSFMVCSACRREAVWPCQL